MKLRSLLFGIALGAAALPATAYAAEVKQPRTLHVHSLDPQGQWGADLSPDGSTVAVAILRSSQAERGGREENFIDAEIWNPRENKRLAQRTLAHRPASAAVTAEWGQVRYADNGQILLVYDGELLNVLRATDLEEITRIDLGLPSWPRDSQVVDLAMAPNGGRLVSVLLSWGGGHGGALRLYDLQTGERRGEWEFEKGYPELGAQVAWRPDGKKLAFTLVPVVPGTQVPREENTLEVIDVESKKVALRFNTGYLAGPVCFTADDKLVTATAEPPWSLLMGTHKIKIWDAKTGKLLREIESVPTGVRGSLAISADGKLLLGYVGMEKSTSKLAANNPTEIVEQRFRLWDLATGKSVAASPKILPNVDKRAHLRLSGKGDHILVFWDYPDKPLLVYD